METKETEVKSNKGFLAENRHNLPQIASSVGANPRMAVSKASAKVQEQASPTKQFANIVTMEEINKSVTPSKELQAKPPSSMPTPPSDGTPSDDSPKSKDSKPLSADITSEEGIAEKNMFDDKASPDSSGQQKKTPRAKTKGDIKKQLMKKKGKKNESDQKDDSSTSSGDTLKASKSVQNIVGSPQPEGCKYVVADMFWAKVGGHPWWPCMIAYDPFDTIFYKTFVNKSKPSYHVQFFGQEGERGWIPDGRMEPYHGKEQHLQWLREIRSKITKSRKKEFEPPNKQRRPAWDIACEEAGEAFKVDRAERRAKFTLSYSPLKTKNKNTPLPPEKVNKKGKRKLSIDGDRSKHTPPKKRRKRTKSVSPISKDCEKLANQKLTQFMVFCSKKRDSVRREHPTYSDSQIEKVLKVQWEQLSNEQKQKFIPMGSDVKNVSQLLPEESILEGSKRTPKPSKKKMESEESGGIVKRRKSSSSGMVRRRLSGSLSFSQGSHYPRNLIDDTIDRVAAGAGEIPTVEAMDLENYDEMHALIIDEETESGNKGNDTDDSSSVSSSKEENVISKSKAKLRGIELEDGEVFEPEIYKLIGNPAIKKENICLLCEEQPGDMIQCDGPCYGSFHVSCLGLKNTPTGTFKCDECTTGLRTCLVCKKSASNLKRCTSTGCGKFYHLECIKKFNLTVIENGRLTCPLHTCATCAADYPKNPKACKGKFYRCVRCPTAYHVGDFCLAAGSMNLGGYNIVCSRHFSPIKTTSHHSHVNVSWCFSCSLGGSLLCCETCPASFHVDCLKIDPPEGAWYCQDCASGKKPLYGDIVWVKIGSYRWWPGEICHPRNVPNNIQEKTHQVGEFPVRFFGSRDYFWLHQARVFLFQEGDKGCKETSSKNLTKTFQKAQKEGAMAYKLWKEFQERREEKQQEINERKPAPYKHIKTNQPVGSVTIYKADPSEVPRCECHPAMEHPCGDYSDCINRMTLEECHPAVCPAGDRCQNQRFQKREYPEAMPFKALGRGWGLKTLVDIKKGEFVNEYVGELVDDEEAKRRFKQAEIDNVSNFYMLTLDTKRIIDAGPKGNSSRFMNHSCAPNCGTQKWTVNGDVRVGLFAITDIVAGTELTFNYNLDALGNEKKKCACGAPTCSGYLGVKAKKEEPVDKPKIKKKKKHKKLQKKVADDECYRCGDGGELIVCDRGSCTKVYHLKCLKLTKMPHGKWLCPWHHCDDCGKPAVKLCDECPNSFCPHHIEGNIFLLPDNKLVCSDHEDILEAVEASKLENEPNAALKLTLTSSSEATSTCSSSPNYSDSDASDSVKETETFIKSDSEGNLTNGDASLESKIPLKKRGRKKNPSGDNLESISVLSPKLQDNSTLQTSGISISPETVPGKSPDKKLGLTNGNGEGENQGKGNHSETKSLDSPKKRRGRQSLKSSTNQNTVATNKMLKSVAAPVYDDTDSDECNLVIDIP